MYPSFSTFVRNDYEILRKFDEVKPHRYIQGKSVLRHLVSQFELCFWLLKHIWSAEIIYCWFADYHSILPSFLAKIFQKKFYLVLGGYDVTYLPEFNYGSFKNPLRAFCARFSISNATLNLAVSEHVKKRALERVSKARIVTIYNGVTPFITKHDSNIKKEDIVLTVAKVDSIQRMKLKGLDFFVKIAEQMPEIKFIMIGIVIDLNEYFENIPSNLLIMGEMEQFKLVEFYQRAKVYCQFSKIESFGLSVAEAMQCECVPVVSDVGALPEVVDECGYILKNWNVEEAMKCIREALLNYTLIGERAKKRIETFFTIEKREKQLKKILSL
ncbi:MAG: glycosyltransferase [Ignavibacteria bacterium]|nr:MAG: glycosyltransferase [Ignavibacteria bacterium]